jgi:tetratricopeptide (TPR) repeat protein
MKKTGASSFVVLWVAILAGCAGPRHGDTDSAPPAAAAVSADDLARRGHALAEAGQSQAALRDLDAALRLDPRHTQATYDRAIVHHAAGQFAAAMTDIDRAVLLDPQNTRVRNARCVIQVAAERNDAGLKNCYHAMLMPGPAAEAQTAFGQALLLLGRPREALQAFDAALKAEPTHLAARYGRGIARQRTGDTEGSVDVQEAMKVSPAAGRTFAAASAP